MSTLQREIQQQRPFKSQGQEAALSLLHTADVVRRSLGQVVEPFGVTLQQYNVLRILRGAGEAGLPTLEIAGRMIEQAPGITRLIDRLESKGLVRRERSAGDRRQVFCWLTPAGLCLLDRLDQPIDAADAIALAMLDGGQLSTLIRLLDRVREGLKPKLATTQGG